MDECLDDALGQPGAIQPNEREGADQHVPALRGTTFMEPLDKKSGAS
ncbi:MAG TPA: hypothetical protein VN713_07375 [Sphingomicrobium sp.]|jgi:hypothetical protein|nr:hypothetical protein [Sphingomicrobium sp.]